jgi:hypothetical protein
MLSLLPHFDRFMATEKIPDQFPDSSEEGKDCHHDCLPEFGQRFEKAKLYGRRTRASGNQCRQAILGNLVTLHEFGVTVSTLVG